MKTNKKTTPSSYAVHIISIPEGGAIKDNATGEMEKGSTDVLPFSVAVLPYGRQGCVDIK